MIFYKYTVGFAKKGPKKPAPNPSRFRSFPGMTDPNVNKPKKKNEKSFLTLPR
jgi:hypothetical protein